MNSFQRSSRLVCLVIVAVWVGGCAARTPSPLAGLTPEQARLVVRQAAFQREAELRDDLAGAFKGGSPSNILVLSGGGASGAFGAGVLSAWSQDASAKRPRFDVVTGVSTGALMATFAFLGQPEDDKTLSQVYTQTSDRDIFAGPIDFGPPNSVFGTKPLAKLIERHVTREVIERVAVAHEEGRRLYVATAELDTGLTIIWPLSRIASSAHQAWAAGDIAAGKAHLDRFRKILLATAAIPILFPPVEIDGTLHIDAGIREALFLRPAMLGRANACESETQTARTVHVVVNTKIISTPEPIGNNLIEISGRSLALYTDALKLFNLRDVATAALNHPAGFKVRWIAVPSDKENPAEPHLIRGIFNPQSMTRLYQMGVAALQSTQWHEGSPTLDGWPD